MGSDKPKEKREKLAALQEIPASEEVVVVATGKYIGEGVDAPRLDTLLLAMPISWRGTLAQYAGRLHRNFEGKHEVRIYDYVDVHIPMLERMYHKRLKGYAELGSEVSIPENEREDILCSYKTPYVLWANDAAADTLNWNEAVAALDLPEDGVLSASFLGSVLLDLTGRAGESPWFDFLSSLRRIAPVVQKKTYILADGSVLPQRILNEQTDEASMELKDAVRKWRCWSYYKLKYADVG